MSEKFDVLILGTGPSASRIATACAEKLKVAVIDSQGIGGTCALRGCNPKKVLVRAAELIDWVRNSNGKLIQAPAAAIEWSKLIAFKREFTDPVVPKAKAGFREKGIAIFEGTARFLGPNTVSVGDHKLLAERIVVGTGAKPASLGIEGEEHLTHSDAFMEWEHLPQKIIFVGGGYISFEFAHVAHHAGAEVRILESSANALSGFEPDIVDQLITQSTKLGLKIDLQTEVKAIEKMNDGQLRVTALQQKRETQYTADAVVHGGGRVPAIEELDLESAGIQANDRGIVVNEYLQSISNPHVYAAGDVAATGQPKLTPVANEEGRTVAKNVLEGNHHTPDYGMVPRVVFTVPAMASIGLSEQQVKEAGYRFEVRSGDMSEWGSVRKIGGRVAAYKIIVDEATNQILGAHLVAPHAEDTINLFALAMKFRLTAQDIKSVPFAFPTFSSDVRSML